MGGNLQIFATTARNFENARQRPILSHQGGRGFNQRYRQRTDRA